MKRKTKNTLRGLAKFLGLKIKFVNYLDDQIQGKLLPREGRILINARKPRNEHFFTVLHEIGHFVVHFKNQPRKHHPSIFDIHWKAEWLERLSSKVRRWYRFVFNKEGGKEWEADVWAMCAFVYIARQLGCRDEVKKFLKRHPEKTGVFLLAVYGTVYCDTKLKIKKFGRAIATPFQFLWKFAVS